MAAAGADAQTKDETARYGTRHQDERSRRQTPGVRCGERRNARLRREQPGTHVGRPEGRRLRNINEVQGMNKEKKNEHRRQSWLSNTRKADHENYVARNCRDVAAVQHDILLPATSPRRRPGRADSDAWQTVTFLQIRHQFCYRHHGERTRETAALRGGGRGP